MRLLKRRKEGYASEIGKLVRDGGQKTLARQCG
jgi:hypothetical protein